MIKLMFKKGTEYFIITINNKVITYWDRFEGKLWGTSLQWLPIDPSIQRKIIESRNKIPASMMQLFNIPQDELDEYNACKDDEEIKELAVRDAKKNGCVLIK